MKFEFAMCQGGEMSETATATQSRLFNNLDTFENSRDNKNDILELGISSGPNIKFYPKNSNIIATIQLGDKMLKPNAKSGVRYKSRMVFEQNAWK